jgi:DNA polymerase III delta subunit
MNLAHMPTLDNDKQLHARLVEHVKKKDYKICSEIIAHLRGRFGGDLDSFYDEIEKRSQKE